MSDLTFYHVVSQVDNSGIVAYYSSVMYEKHYPDKPRAIGLIKHTLKGGCLYCLIKTVQDSYAVLIINEAQVILKPTVVQTKCTEEGMRYRVLDTEFKKLFNDEVQDYK